MDYLKMKSHHVRVLVDPNGNTLLIPKSIAFASLSQAAFNRFLNRMIYVICSEIIPGLKEQELRDEILAMVGT